jgi:hypothetical protein
MASPFLVEVIVKESPVIDLNVVFPEVNSSK